MLKNKLKIIALLMVIILTLTLPIVRAENETPAQEATPEVVDIPEVTSNEATNPENATTTADDNFKKSDVYLTGDDVTIDYIVDGNLFVFANKVTINSQIGGDAFICASSIIVGEEGYVFSNLFTFARDVTINGIVYDLYAASQNTTINGYVYRDVRIGSDKVNLFGTIGRNAFVTCSTLNFTPNNNEGSEVTTASPSINGNLAYSTNEEISIPEGIVSGETTFEKSTSSSVKTVQDYIIDLGTFVVTILAVWLLCSWLAPKFLENNSAFLTTKKVLPVIAFGLLAPFVLVTLAVVFFILGLTSALGILLLVALLALIVISNSMFVISLNSIICNKLKIEKKMGIFGVLVIVSIATWLISLIPFVGSIWGIIIFVLGTGIALSGLLLKDKKIKE